MIHFRRRDWHRLRCLAELIGAAALGAGVYIAVLLAFSLG